MVATPTCTATARAYAAQASIRAAHGCGKYSTISQPTLLRGTQSALCACQCFLWQCRLQYRVVPQRPHARLVRRQRPASFDRPVRFVHWTGIRLLQRVQRYLHQYLGGGGSGGGVGGGGGGGVGGGWLSPPPS